MHLVLVKKQREEVEAIWQVEIGQVLRQRDLPAQVLNCKKTNSILVVLVQVQTCLASQEQTQSKVSIILHNSI